MKLYKRGETWWVTGAVDGVRVRKSTGTGDRRLAEKRGQEMLQEAQDGREDWTLGEATRRCSQVRWEGTKGERTAVLNAEAALSFFGDGLRLSELTTARLDDYVRHLKDRGNANGTVNRKLAAVSAVLRVGHERGALKAMPKVPRQRETEGRLRWLSEDEELALLGLLHQWEQHEAWYLTALLLDTGLRLGEALKLQGRDVTGDQLHVWESKGGIARTVPLTQRAAHAWVSGGPWTLTKDSYYHTFKRACAVLGWDDVSPHTLRHTFASRLVQRGVTMAVIQKLLGHKSITTTMRYAHVAPDNLADAIGVLEERPVPNLRRVK